jgi:hypothetical protein
MAANLVERAAVDAKDVEAEVVGRVAPDGVGVVGVALGVVPLDEQMWSHQSTAEVWCGSPPRHSVRSMTTPTGDRPHVLRELGVPRAHGRPPGAPQLVEFVEAASGLLDESGLTIRRVRRIA